MHSMMCYPSFIRLVLLVGVLTVCIQLFKIDPILIERTLHVTQTVDQLAQQSDLIQELEKQLQRQQEELQQDRRRRNKRTAIVWTTKGITTQCEADRVRHLVETSGGMDVWILHSHHVLTGNVSQIEKSRNFIKDLITEYPNVHQEMQSTEARFLPFDELAGSSKSSFLRFLVRHFEYDYAWIVENDLFYTGPWTDLFNLDTTVPGDVEKMDFLTSRINSHQKDKQWWWLSEKECTVQGMNCTKLDPKYQQVHWMFARISSRFAKNLLRDIYYGEIKGLHEAVVGAYCNLKNYTLATIEHQHQNRIGYVSAGHLGEFTTMEDHEYDVSSRNPLPGQLVHPVKCAAYDHHENNNNNNNTRLTMAEEIQKWTTIPIPPPGWDAAAEATITS